MYELDEGNTPAYASVSAAVDCCEQLGKRWASRLVNGCLRQYQRDRDAMLASLGESERAALPGWLFKLLAKTYPAQLEQIGRASKSRPPLTLRVNQLRISKEDYQVLLSDAEVASINVGLNALTLVKPMPVNQVPLFEEGFSSVQDASAQHAANLLSITADMSVLDACAAPGGKACHLAERGARVTAVDVSEARLGKVTENAARLNLNVRTVLGDARCLSEVLANELFDAILLDVPCSATGVMRRNPDVKVIRTRADVEQFASLQLELLQSAWLQLAAGGQLLYATCSLLPQENDAVIDAFIARESNASVSPLPMAVGIDMRFGQQVIPSVDGGDGLYYSLLIKS
jgi:16S rRNA (cytosine967-C5)-methyltransferase